MQPGGSDLVKSRNKQSLPTSSRTTGIQARHPRSQPLRFSVELSVSLDQYVRSRLVLLACRPDPLSCVCPGVPCSPCWFHSLVARTATFGWSQFAWPRPPFLLRLAFW